MADATSQLRTLARGLDVLEIVESSPGPISLSEVARALDEPAPMAFRVLQTLEARGYVRRRPEDKRYSHTGRSTGSGAVRRALDLLKAMSRFSFRGGTVEDLAECAGLEPASVEELLVPLVEAQVVEAGYGGRWRVAFGLMELVQPLLKGDDVTEMVRPLMEWLNEETEETVSLYRRSGDRQVVTAVIPSPKPIRYVLDVGTTYPLHLAAAGKAELAALPESERESFLRDPALEQLTGWKPDAEQLRRQIGEIQERGFAVSSGERVEGASAVATAIRDQSGAVRGVLSLMMPSFRTSEHELHRYGEILVREVAALRIPAGWEGHKEAR
ncbi:helix-turn-helix domain-containing protein [Ectothiorhodospiraceae bacterium WFHF3C12]|nr:helix-turn-helix domain-containing protein [Ectothiorhodospiraceae bacterium WFHF3C12]